MWKRRITAILAVIALLVGVLAVPGLANNGQGSDPRSERASEAFDDMHEYPWGLSHVTKMQVKGVFKGRGDRTFAPGANITHQEAAVAAVRLVNLEATAQGLTAAEVDALLKDIPDQAQIATWARGAVAMLVKKGAAKPNEPFKPMEHATRLYAAVLLVDMAGFKAEAQAKMQAELSFKDAAAIPAEYRGYVAAAVDHGWIAGYEDMTFQPNKPVKRVEMAVLMGRVDQIVERNRGDELKGVIKSVDTAARKLVITLHSGTEVTVELAAGAAIFLNSVQKALTDLTVGLRVEVKLDASGKVIFVEAKPEGAQDRSLSGTVSALAAATAGAAAQVTILGTSYPISLLAVITLNGAPASLADLKVGDTVEVKLVLGLVTRIEAARSVTLTGTIHELRAARGNNPAKLEVALAGSASAEFKVPAATVITINGAAAQFADLKLGDTVKVTRFGEAATRIEVTR